MDAPAQWDEPGKEFYRTNAIADIRRAGGTISDSATYEEVRRYQAGFRDTKPSEPVAASLAPAADSARRSASDAHAEDDKRQQLKRKPVVTKR